MAIKLESKLLSGRLPLLGKLPSARRQILTGALVFFLLVDAAVVWFDARQSTFGTFYIATVGKIRMLSQRLAKAAQQASQGNLEAFKQLRESRDEFDAQMKLLLSGGEAGGVSLPATSGDARPALDALDTEVEEERDERRAGYRRREEPDRPGHRGAPDERAQPGAAGAGRRGVGAQRADRRLGAPERDRLAAHDAHAAHGEEREHHARRGGDRPGSVVPARQGHQHVPRHPAGLLKGSEALRIQR